MPIEFHCSACQKLLRVPDGTAGKQAKCPECGAVVAIPPASEPAANPFGAPPPPPAPLPRGGDAENPYRSPVGMDSSWQAGTDWPTSSGARTGPAWERDGKSFGSFWQTIKDCFSNPIRFFREMRREGGFGAPLVFMILTGYIGILFTIAYAMMFQAIGLLGNAPAGDPAADVLGALAGIGIALGCVFVLWPIAAMIITFIQAGVLHLMLMIVGGAAQPYETTFRVLAYSSGTTSLLLIIPCGQYIQWIPQLAFLIIGLWAAHEISGWRAAAAVFLPIVICCGLYIAFLAIVILAAAGGF